MTVENLHYFCENWLPEAFDAEADVVVYGGSAGGVVAALTAIEAGRSVILLHPGKPLGGMTTGGLSFTDLGNAAAIGGRARQFYRELGAHYGTDEEWCFEPSAAAGVLGRWIESAELPVRFGCYLQAVEFAQAGRGGRRLSAVRLWGGSRVAGRAFIDATYEGDLLAAAGVPYTLGREGNAAYGESLNGVQIHPSHQFHNTVDPYRIEGDPASGLLPHVQSDDGLAVGEGDRRVQAYNFRVCMTDRPANRVPFPKPAVYKPEEYLIVERWLRDPQTDVFAKFDAIRGGKTDTNNHGAASTDCIGLSHAWPEADPRQREAIFAAHVSYQQGLHWYMANSPDIPADIRDRYATFGLAADEFTDTGHWPHQLYVREARRMVADVVITEHHCLGREVAEDPVGLGAYQMDSHNCRRMVRDGRVVNEGDVQYPLPTPYGISYRAIIPPAGSVANLAVPVCVSASHIAFGSVRMEPVFMILGQSAATAVDLALANRCSLQDLPYDELADALTAAGQILTTDAANDGSAGNIR